jgi:dTMP kinase
LCVGDNGPDLTFVLDVPPDVARDRIGARGLATDAIDSRPADYHVRVRQAFLDIAASEPDRCVVLDASSSAETLVAQAFQAISDRYLAPAERAR